MASSGPRRPRRDSPVECPPLWETPFPLRPQPPLPPYDRPRRGHRRRCRCRNNSNNSAEAATVPNTVSWCTATPAPPRTECLLILPPPPLLLLLLSHGGRGGGFPQAVLKTPSRTKRTADRPGRFIRDAQVARREPRGGNSQHEYHVSEHHARSRDTAGQRALIVFVLFFPNIILQYIILYY